MWVSQAEERLRPTQLKPTRDDMFSVKQKRMISIDYLIDGDVDESQGYQSPGWYFWLEDEANVSGPYSTKLKAILNLQIYCILLESVFEERDY